MADKVIVNKKGYYKKGRVINKKRNRDRIKGKNFNLGHELLKLKDYINDKYHND